MKEIANAGITCNCGAYMFARVYADKIEFICPHCGVMFIKKRNKKTEDMDHE